MEVFHLKNRLSYLQLVILSLFFVAYGCGGGGYVTPAGSGGNGGGGDNTGGGGTGGNSVVSMQGSWEFQFQSAVSPANFFVVEANLSQAGTHVFSGAPSTLVYQSKGPLVTSLTLSRFGGQCDNGGGTDQVTFDGMLSNQQPTTETITFTLTENGSLGSSVLTGTASTNGSSIVSTGGTYTLPASCGFPEDHGTFYGYQDSIGAGNYAGTFNSGADAITMNFVPVTAGFGITATGTDNGTPFTLTGSTVGLSVTLTGTVSGHAVTWFGIYDSTYNTFNFYTLDGKRLGSLGPH